MIKFSIIIPVYNCEKYLNKCIESVLNQTYKQFELIVINDGSTDDSLKIIKSYKDQRIKLINKSNTGVSDSRNIGLKKANYEYICFLDADDYYEYNTLQTFRNIIIKYNPDMISCGIFSEIENYTHKIKAIEKFYQNKKQVKQNIVYLYNQNMLFNVWNNVYKKSIIDKNNIKFPKYNFGEDRNFNHNYLKYINNLYNTKLCLYHYVRERYDSITNSYYNDLFNIRLKEVNDFKNFFIYFEIEDKDFNNFIAKFFIERVVGCLENCFKKKNKFLYTYKELKKIINHNKTQEYLKYYKPSSLKMRLLIIPIKIKNTFLCYLYGKLLHTIKSKYPVVFNKFKNKR